MKYSVFFGVAMEHQDSEETHILESIVNQVESKYGKSFFAPRIWPTEADYIPHNQAFDVVLDGLEQSSLFVLYYPNKVISGALVELGIAIAMNKPILIYTREINNITYFMRAHKDLITDPNMIMSWIDNQMSVMV